MTRGPLCVFASGVFEMLARLILLPLLLLFAGRATRGSLLLGGRVASLRARCPVRRGRAPSHLRPAHQTGNSYRGLVLRKQNQAEGSLNCFRVLFY